MHMHSDRGARQVVHTTRRIDDHPAILVEIRCGGPQSQRVSDSPSRELRDHGYVLPAIVVVCTKDRPEELLRCLDALIRSTARLPVLIIDASSDQRSVRVCDRVRARGELELRLLAATPGLAAQRNAGIEEARKAGAEALVFIDDDVVVEPEAVGALLAQLEAEPALAATGAVVVDEPPAHAIAVKAAFCLWSRRPGVVLRSGRNVIGHYPAAPWPRRVDWLSTCAIAIRLDLLGELRFDERLAGYSYGEDLDLTFRLSRRHPLSVTRVAQVSHRPSQRGRPSRRALAHRRVQLLHAWVNERSAEGLRRRWFWWSVIGETLLLLANGVRDRQAWSEAIGVVTGSAAVVRHGGSRAAL